MWQQAHMNTCGKCAVLVAASKLHTTLSWLILQSHNKVISGRCQCSKQGIARAACISTLARLSSMLHAGKQ